MPIKVAKALNSGLGQGRLINQFNSNNMNKSLIEQIEEWLKEDSKQRTKDYQRQNVYFIMYMKDSASFLLARALDELKSLH